MDLRPRTFSLLSPLAMMFSALITISSPAIGAEANAPRLSTSTLGEHRQPARYPALRTEADPASAATREDRRQIAHLGNFWVYSAGVQLSFDYDHDGHYSGFGISFDIDTVFDYAPVYAVLYLSLAGGPWNEYAVTGEFTVSGSGSADRVTIETELESGYPSGSYDHYIEVYDAHTHVLLTEYGPHDSHYWSGLLFEGYDHDRVNFGASLTLDFTGAGSLDPLSMLLLPVTAGACYLRRRSGSADRRR
jgi:hypothetical protein